MVFKNKYCIWSRTASFPLVVSHEHRDFLYRKALSIGTLARSDFSFRTDFVRIVLVTDQISRELFFERPVPAHLLTLPGASSST